MKKSHLIVIAVASCALLGWGGVQLFSSSEKAIDEAGIYAVSRGDFKITLTEKGTFQAKNVNEVRAKIKRGAKVEWLAEEGSRVEQGDIIVELDRTNVLSKIEQFQNEVIQYESEFKAAETEELIQEAQNRTDIENAELSLAVAKVELQKLIEGDIPKAERDLELRIEKALSDKRRADEKVAANVELFAEEFVTKDQVEQDLITQRTAVNDLKTAELDQELYNEYERPLQIRQFEAAKVDAERGLERARQRAEAQLEAKRARVQQKRLSLSLAQKGLAENQEELVQMQLRAPVSGIVLYGSTRRSRWDSDEIKVGSEVWPRTVIATIPDTSEMIVRIQIHEADIEKVKSGVPAVITSETQKGKSFKGEVTRVDSVANAGNRWSGDVKKFNVEVGLTVPSQSLRPGTSARVEILVGEAVDVLHVPLQGIHARRGSYFCFVAQGRSVTRTAVKLGRSNKTHVEVLSGLEAGDQVLLYDPDLNKDAEGEKSGAAEGKSSGRGKGGRGNGGSGRGRPQS